MSALDQKGFTLAGLGSLILEKTEIKLDTHVDDLPDVARMARGLEKKKHKRRNRGRKNVFLNLRDVDMADVYP
eukprot:CAMPEP_0184304038 /NCGR_PEP_ID=MMETSP1049-20130417/13661_1 /TAXON_ID=77928 /ORGANISM="Proteomonas sulcata, Strain CCMP704" /LENGTH=72 /DNA_ID=CAMNT_0026615763 /DNA_START=140 /DNA_END=358 /DNA_ORIENTATION=-